MNDLTVDKKLRLCACLCGVFMFVYDHLILPYYYLWPITPGIDRWMSLLSMIPSVLICLCAFLKFGKRQWTTGVYVFFTVAIHFLLILACAIPLYLHYEFNTQSLDTMLLGLLLILHDTAPRALIQYTALFLLTTAGGIIGWLLSKKKQPEVSETPDA